MTAKVFAIKFLWKLNLFPLVLLLLAGCAATTPAHHVAADYELEVLVPGSAMHGVHGLAFDQHDVLYGASLVGYSVYRIDTQTGEVSTVVGPPLGNADDVAIGPDGTIAWTAGAFSAVHALTPDGEFKVLASNLPAVNSIDYAPDGRLFVTQIFGGDALWEIDPLGVTEPRRVAKRLGGLNGFEVTADNQLYGPLFLKGKVVRVDLASGEVTEIADGFTVPAAVNLDAQGRLLVVDFDDGSVTRLDPELGDREIIAQLEPPLDNLAINSRDDIYVSNPATNTITEINPDTGATREVTSGQFSAPGGISIAQIDGRTVVMVADFWGNRYFDALTGERTMLSSPTGVMASASLTATDEVLALASIWPFGLVYFIDRQAQKVIKTAKFKAPYNPVFLADGSVVVADYKAGTLTRLAAGKSRDKSELAGGLDGPLGLVVANDRQLYVGEYNGGRIWRIDVEGGARHLVMDGLDRPEGLALTGDGLLLVAETGTQRLLRIEPGSGVIDVVADGLAIGLQGGEDLPRPFIPTGVAVDGEDNIYIAADITNELYKLTRK
ncbi:MAG: hypothetical protein CL797_11705 [Chromatiales bacterium]|jgi:streptogramin lyase|nr:hypothetical protein [Chromatiales bacterium]